MAYNVELVPLSEVELWEAIDWYDEQLPDLGKAFAEELSATVQTIQRNPKQFPKVLRTKRRALLRQFPYVIIFEVVENTIYILAIFHTRRNPDDWTER